MEKISLQPVGIFNCAQSQPVDSPRQGALASASTGELVLNATLPEASLNDLAGFERIWLLYAFHKNSGWKPMVRPPRGEKKRGVFATRSPYRPNGIGLSCVKLERVEGRRLWVSEHDLLDQTPILDIKPYLVEADCFPNIQQGWLQDLPAFPVTFSDSAIEKIQWLEEQLGKPVRQTIEQQLSFEPSNGQIKRVKSTDDGYNFHYRTWVLPFQLMGEEVRVLDLHSHYSRAEMGSQEDPYGDKAIHRTFVVRFS